MLDCRYNDLCVLRMYSHAVACGGKSCWSYRPMPDVKALVELADELEGEGLDGWASGPVNVGRYARRIREACGEVVR